MTVVQWRRQYSACSTFLSREETCCGYLSHVVGARLTLPATGGGGREQASTAVSRQGLSWPPLFCTLSPAGTSSCCNSAPATACTIPYALHVLLDQKLLPAPTCLCSHRRALCCRQSGPWRVPGSGRPHNADVIGRPHNADVTYMDLDKANGHAQEARSRLSSLAHFQSTGGGGETPQELP